MPLLFWIVVLSLFGLLVGSFLNVVAHRVPLDLSIAHPPSACPACGTPIAPRDNIPLVSWLLLRARCRHCQTAISFRYPALELTNALLWAGATLLIGPTWALPAFLWFLSMTLVLISVDLDHHRLPNKIVYPGTVVGLALLLLPTLMQGQLARFGWSLVAGTLAFALMLLLALLVRGGFGMGDVKLSFVLGVFVGYQVRFPPVSMFRALSTTGLSIFLSFLIGGLTGLTLMALRRKRGKDHVAFGPAMILGAWIASFWGWPIMETYLGL